MCIDMCILPDFFFSTNLSSKTTVGPFGQVYDFVKSLWNVNEVESSLNFDQTCAQIPYDFPLFSKKLGCVLLVFKIFQK